MEQEGAHKPTAPGHRPQAAEAGAAAQAGGRVRAHAHHPRQPPREARRRPPSQGRAPVLWRDHSRHCPQAGSPAVQGHPERQALQAAASGSLRRRGRPLRRYSSPCRSPSGAATALVRILQQRGAACPYVGSIVRQGGCSRKAQRERGHSDRGIGVYREKQQTGRRRPRERKARPPTPPSAARERLPQSHAIAADDRLIPPGTMRKEPVQLRGGLAPDSPPGLHCTGLRRRTAGASACADPVWASPSIVKHIRQLAGIRTGL